MEEYIGKTIKEVIQKDDIDDGYVLIFTDGTNVEIGAECNQNVGFVTTTDGVDVDDYRKCSGCGWVVNRCDCAEED
jgi:hypothetical protein